MDYYSYPYGDTFYLAKKTDIKTFVGGPYTTNWDASWALQSTFKNSADSLVIVCTLKDDNTVYRANKYGELLLTPSQKIQFLEARVLKLEEENERLTNENYWSKKREENASREAEQERSARNSEYCRSHGHSSSGRGCPGLQDNVWFTCDRCGASYCE